MAFLEVIKSKILIITSDGVCICGEQSHSTETSRWIVEDWLDNESRLPAKNDTANGLPVLAVDVYEDENKTLLAVLTCDKCINIFNIGLKTKVYSKTIKRQGTSIKFCMDGMKVLCADRTGDVTIFSIDSDESKILLGHYSMLLDMAINNDQQFLITSDRDNRIRVSHFPNGYNIQSFCLGHTDYVESMTWLAPNVNEEQLLVSYSGVCCWFERFAYVQNYLGQDDQSLESRVSTPHILIINFKLPDCKIVDHSLHQSGGCIIDAAFGPLREIFVLQRGLGSSLLCVLQGDPLFECEVLKSANNRLKDALDNVGHLVLPLQKLGHLSSLKPSSEKKVKIS